MEKKVAKGLLAAVVVFSNVLSTTNIASASNESANLNALTLTTEEAVPVKAESDTTAITGTVEETNSIVQEESSATDAIEENVTVEVQNDSAAMPIEAEDTSIVELDQSSTEDASMVKSEESSTKEENQVEASEEMNLSDKVEENELTYQVKTKSVDNVDDFKTAIATSNTTIELNGNIVINEELNITSNNITIEGNGNTITVRSTTDKVAALVVKNTSNVVLKNLTIKSETTKPGLTLWNATDKNSNGVVLENIEIIGSKTGVGLDIYNSIAELTNITFSTSKDLDIRIRNGSKVTLNTHTKHSKDISCDIQTIQKTGEAQNEITNLSTYYKIPGKEIVNNGTTTTNYNSIIKEVSTLEELLKYAKDDKTVIKLEDNIKVDQTGTIEFGKNVTIDGNGKTLDLNKVANVLLKGNDIVVENIEIINSNNYGINIYNSRNVQLKNITVSNSSSHGIFVNGSIVELHNFETSSNGAEGIKVTRATSLNNQTSHVDSIVTVTGTDNKQEESDIDVIVVNLDVNGKISNNKFIHDQGNITYTEHHNEVVQTKYGWQDYTIDYVVEQKSLDVTNKNAVMNATGQSIELVNDGVFDNTENLKKLIEYAASHSIELQFPAGTYKITGDIDLSELNLPASAASNFKMTGAPNGLSIIDGSQSDKMLKIFNVDEDHKMSYVNIENLVFNNVGLALKGEYKKNLAITNNVFMNGKSSGDMEAYIEVQLHGKKDFPINNDPNKKASIVNKIDSNIFLRGANNLGKGIVSTNNENIEITNNFFGNLEGIEDAKKMLPDTVDTKLDLVKDKGLAEGNQGNFYTAIDSEKDLDTLIQNNYFNLAKNGQESEHIIYAKGYENLQIVGNYFRGQENDATGGVKISNGKNAYIGSNHFSDVPLLTYIDSSLADAEALLHNTVIYNNLFHQKTNFGKEGTGIIFDQSSKDGDVKNFIIYQNEFKSDERDGINLSEHAQAAVDDNQFLVYGNTYKTMNTPVNFIGNVKLDKESELADVEGKLTNHTEFAHYKDTEIPLTPPEVDYTYLKEIYDEAQEFLNDIINNDLVGDTPGKYPTNLVTELQEMMAEIDKLYNDGKIHQAETNTFVTSLDKLYEIVQNGKIPDNSGDGSGDGDNSGEENIPGDEDNSGDGNVPGDGDNSGEENIPGDEDNSGEENIPGDGDNSGEGNVPGDGDNSGEGNVPGDGDNSGEGNVPGDEGNSGEGNIPGDGNGSGDGKEETQESTGDTINKPTTDEQQTIDRLPQTSEVLNRVLTALGIFLILSAGLLLVKRSRSE